MDGEKLDFTVGSSMQCAQRMGTYVRPGIDLPSNRRAADDFTTETFIGFHPFNLNWLKDGIM